MANGRLLPGRVAPTQIGQGKTYSQMLKEQLDLIQQQREKNLTQVIEQDKQNREFRQQQLQNIYDFDISGLAPTHIQALSTLQKNMANSLNPNSEDSYQNSGQLIADIALLNNIYAVGKGWASQRDVFGAQYAGFADGTTPGAPGTQVNASYQGLQSLNEEWTRGGFDGEITVGGSAGNRTITGIPRQRVEGEFVAGAEAVDFFENPFLNNPSSFWAPEILPAPNYHDEAAYRAMTDENVDESNYENYAVTNFRVIPITNKETYRKQLYDQKYPTGADFDTLETLAADQNMTLKEYYKEIGIDDESLIDDYAKAILEGIRSRKRQKGESLFDPQGRTTQEQTNLVKPVNILAGEDSEYNGKIVSADYERGLSASQIPVFEGSPAPPITVIYDNGRSVTLTMSDSPEAYRQFEQAMGTTGLEEMLTRAGYKFDNVQGTGTTGTGTDGTGDSASDGAEAVQQTLEDPDTIGEFRSAIDNLADSRTLGIFPKPLNKNVQLAKEIQNLSTSEQIERINQEISDLERQQEEARQASPAFDPTSYKRSSPYRRRQERIEELKQIQGLSPSLGEETKNRRIDEIDGQIARVKEQQLELQERFEKEGGTDRNLKRREALNNQMMNLEQELQSLKGLDEVIRDYSLDDSFVPPLTLPEVTITPKKKTEEAAVAIEDISPEAADVVEDAGAAINPNTQEPVKVTDSAGEKQQATMMTLGGLVEMEKQEADIVEDIRKISVNVLGDSIATWQWDDWQRKLKRGEVTDPVPAWCAAWMAHMILIANPDFDFDVLDYAVEGKPGERAEEEQKMNRVRARFYKNVGTEVPKLSSAVLGTPPVGGDRYAAQVGDIVVKSRMVDGKRQSHVGFFVGYAENGDVLILGGNQEDELNVTAYPYSEVDAMRRLEVPALTKEQVETISADIKEAGKTK
tara:strand:- start:3196 stop:5949 length:2754 start_codon:yes stop_codon:yes gene_type:complete